MAAYISFQPSDYFNAKLWTGNSTTDRAMTGVGFQPDLLWVKGRNEGTDHELNDSVRGSTKYIRTNVNAVEGTEAESVKSFDADGYTLGNANYWNWTAKTFVGWSWKGGTTSGIATNGSTTITPSAYSFNQTSGFSAIAYTGNGSSGAKLAHGLGAVPEMIIVKNLGTTNNWAVYHHKQHATAPQDYALEINGYGAAADDAAMWHDTAPDSVNITLGNSGATNDTSNTYIAYCFTGKIGYSKFGSYVANNSDDGAFIYTGFNPSFVMVKSTSGGTYKSWSMFGTTRQPTNLNVAKTLYANRAYEEGNRGQGTDSTTIPAMDILSNGFKCRVGNDEINTASDTYVYMAFAEFPIVSSNSKAGTAR